jgi:hypothetical protein
MEVTPRDEDHFLAFDIDEEISPRQSGREICAAVRDAGGFGFGAHPFSRGSERFKRGGYPFREPECLDGLELWSFLNDTGERLRSVADIFRMVLAPTRIIGGPPPGNVEFWDRMGREKRVVAVGGLDSHQFGLRIAGHVPLRLMGYKRSFRLLRTHVLVPGGLTGELERDRSLVYEALREGRCYIAVDAHANAKGFSFWADGPVHMGEEVPFEPGRTLHARIPRAADIRLIRDGEVIAEVHSNELDHPIEGPGIHRLEVDLVKRPWILSNALYIR